MRVFRPQRHGTCQRSMGRPIRLASSTISARQIPQSSLPVPSHQAASSHRTDDDEEKKEMNHGRHGTHGHGARMGLSVRSVPSVVEISCTSGWNGKKEMRHSDTGYTEKTKSQMHSCLVFSISCPFSCGPCLPWSQERGHEHLVVALVRRSKRRNNGVKPHKIENDKDNKNHGHHRKHGNFRKDISV